MLNSLKEVLNSLDRVGSPAEEVPEEMGTPKGVVGETVIELKPN